MNKENPLVSVIIITYNSSRYIIDTLESIRNQTYDNIELIVSDDCSKDNTVEVCSEWIDRYKDRFANTILITVPENTGISANSNRGLRAASGTWLKSISGDDMLLSNCISDNIEFSKSIPEESFIVSDMNEINEEGVLIRERNDNLGLNFISNLPTAGKQLKLYSRWPAFLNTPTFFCKKEIVDKINLCDEGFRIFEDMTIVHRLMEMNVKLYYMKKPTVAYRIHENSISRAIKMEKRREEEAFYFFQKYQMKNLNLWNPLDLSVYYEYWLRFKYKGAIGLRGDTVLRKLSLFYWYMRLNGVKSY